MVIHLAKPHGMMEYWNVGLLGIKSENQTIPQEMLNKGYFKPIIPRFQDAITPDRLSPSRKPWLSLRRDPPPVLIQTSHDGTRACPDFPSRGWP